MTMKFEQAEAIITKVEQMRKWQKEYFAHRDALALRKAKDLEKEIDTMIIDYRGGNLWKDLRKTIRSIRLNTLPRDCTKQRSATIRIQPSN